MDKTFIIPLPKKETVAYLEYPNRIFVGREKVRKRLFNAVKNSLKKRGSFLVGGYRGVGKSLLVQKVIDELKDEGNFNVAYVGVNLSIDSQLNIHDILADLAKILNRKIAARKSIFHRYRKLRIIANIVFLLLTLVFIADEYVVADDLSQSIYESIKISKNSERNKILTVVLSSGSLFLLIANVLIARSRWERLSKKSEDLLASFRYSKVLERTVGLPEQIFSFSLKQIKNEETITTRRALDELIEILNEMKGRGGLWLPWKKEYATVIVFDEIDKINPGVAIGVDSETSKSRKEKVDLILAGLKPLINDSDAVFIFIAGREMVDGYHSESGYTSVLYEGVFQEIFYVPTLLSDHSDGQNAKLSSMVGEYVDRVLSGKHKGGGENLCEDVYRKFNDRLINYNKYARSDRDGDRVREYDIDIFRQLTELKFIRGILIKYLTLHSRGNCKRLSMMLKEFIYASADHSTLRHIYEDPEVPEDQVEIKKNAEIFGLKLEKNTPFLMFKPEDIKRLYISSKLYTYYDMSVARHLYKSDDKLIVSSLITLLDVARYHAQGFNRSMLERTVSGIDVHAESNLSHIIDELLGNTFYSVLRRTSDNLFQYRFYLGSEIEIMYLTRTIGARASSFEFSLDSADPVRKHYLAEVEKQSAGDSNNSKMSAAELKIILGDIYLSEKSYDKCYSCYTDAISLLKDILRSNPESFFRKGGGVSQVGQAMLVEVLLKRGLLEEVRDNAPIALKSYEEAIVISRYTLEVVANATEASGGSGDIVIRNNYLENVGRPGEWMQCRDVGSVNVRNLALLANAIAAYEFAALKGNIDCRAMFRGALFPLNASVANHGEDPRHPNDHAVIGCVIEKSESVGGENQAGSSVANACNFRLYGRLALLNFYYGDHERLIQTGQGFIESLLKSFDLKKWNVDDLSDENVSLNLFNKANPFALSYLYGQSLFCLVATEIKGRLSKPSEKSYEKNGISRKERLSSQRAKLSKEIILDWVKLINELLGMDEEQIIYDAHLSHEELEKALSDGGDDPLGSRKLKICFKILFISALGMERRGRHAMATEMYNSILLNWIALLEFIPWRELKTVNSNAAVNELKQSLRARPKWIEYCVKRGQRCTSKANLLAMAREREYFFSGNGGEKFPHDVMDVLNAMYDKEENLGGAKGGIDESQVRAERLNDACLASLPIWYRSNSSCYQLIFGLWENYCRTSIHCWCTQGEDIGEPNSFYINKLPPPLGTLPRVSSIYWWLRGRYLALSVIYRKAKDVAEYYEDLLESFVCLTRAIQESKLSSRSEDPDTFPPKAIMYYNLYELIEEFGQNKELDFEGLISDLKDRNPSLPPIYLSKEHLLNVVHRQLSDLGEISNITSNTYRRKMKNKYFLYDDFEDPMFLSEWSFVAMLSSGTDLYRWTEIMRNSSESNHVRTQAHS